MKLAVIYNAVREGTTGEYLERACRQLGVACDHWELRDAERIPAEYDLYLRVDHGDDYLVPLPDRLRPAAFYAIDTHLPHSWSKIRRTAGRYDAIFCCHRDAVPGLPRAEWLPVACDPAAHAAPGAAPQWDVAFVGTDGGVPRKFYLQVLREKYPNSRIGWAAPSELGRVYGQARIGFNYAIADDVNMRVFEVLASGALLVTNRLAGNDFEQLGLRDREHLVFYHKPVELLAVIDYYLAHDDERCSVASAGRRAALAGHTYAHRMRRLLTSAARRLGLTLPNFPNTDEPMTDAITEEGR